MSSGTSNPYRVREGETATLMCTVTDANPNNNITWRWFQTDRLDTNLNNGHTYTIPNIQRERSGSYSCTASNNAGTSDPASIIVDVQCMYFIHNLLKYLCIYNFFKFIIFLSRIERLFTKNKDEFV